MTDDIIKLLDKKREDEDQYTLEESVEWLKKKLEEEKIDRVVILYVAEGEVLPNFAQASRKGNYSYSDLNWDIDQFKRLILSGGYEPEEEEGQ